MKDVRIQLTRYDVAEKDASLGSYPLVVRATGFNIESEIFVYHAVNSEMPYSGDVFEAVATPNHMEELSKNKPFISSFTNEALPYYRRDQLEVVCRSVKEINDIWKSLKNEVSKLVADYKALEELRQTEVVDIDDKRVVIREDALNSSISSLYTDPATVVDLSESGNITTPDASVPGWLPINVGNFKNVPKHAKLYYNLDAHNSLKEIFKSGVKQPETMHRMLLNGYDYSLAMYAITEEGIFWKDYEPSDFSNDAIGLPQPTVNPWAEDYVVGHGSSQANAISLITYS